MKSIPFAIIVLMILLSSGCSGPSIITNETSVVEEMQTVAVPTPQAGKAVISGKLIQTGNKNPIPDQLVRLAKIYGTGTDSFFVYNESSDPGAYTTEGGTLIIPDVEPGLYAIILIDSNGNYATINENVDKILTVEAEANEVVEVGEVVVDLSTP